jgi:hypothetical protein
MRLVVLCSVLALSLFTTTARAAVGRTDIVDSPAADAPFPSAVQRREFVPPREPDTDANKSECLIDMACFCDGPLNTWQQCAGPSTCRPEEGALCAYWRDDYTRCSTMTDVGCGYTWP